MPGDLLTQGFVYLVAAVVSVPLSKRLGLGSVLGYLIAGAAIGPHLLGLVGGGADVMHVAEFGVIMMLFLIGLELRPSSLWRMRGAVLGLGGLQVGVTTLLLGAFGVYVGGLSVREAAAVGMILALSSTAIVLQTLAEKGQLGTTGGQTTFAVLLFQDIAVIPMLALLPLLAVAAGGDVGAVDGHGGDDGHGGHGAAWVTSLPGWQRTLVVLGAVAAIVFAGRVLARHAMRYIASARLPELFTAASLLLVVGITLLMQAVGLSPALGAFVAGVVLADSEYRHELEADIEPFKGLLLGLFFIGVGASIDFPLIGEQPGVIVGLAVALVGIKFAVLAGLARGAKLPLGAGALFAFALAQGGEFAFVLFAFASQQNVLTADVIDPLIAVVALSMAVTPLLLMVEERVVRPRLREAAAAATRKADVVEEKNRVLMAGFGRFGHMVGLLLRSAGVGVTVLDLDERQIEVLRKLDIRVYYGDATRVDLLHAAGAEAAELFVCAVDDPAKALEIVKSVRAHFPHLKILARARGRPHSYEMLRAGADCVEREMTGSSLELGYRALVECGMSPRRAWRAMRRFRAFDDEYAREAAQLWGDDAKYFDRARTRRQELERVMKAELGFDLDAETARAWEAKRPDAE